MYKLPLFYVYHGTIDIWTPAPRRLGFAFVQYWCWNGSIVFVDIILILSNNTRLHENTYKMVCAPSDDSAQSGHRHSLIRAFSVYMEQPWTFIYSLSAKRRLIRLSRCPGLVESSNTVPDLVHAVNTVISLCQTFFKQDLPNLTIILTVLFVQNDIFKVKNFYFIDSKLGLVWLEYSLQPGFKVIKLFRTQLSRAWNFNCS